MYGGEVRTRLGDLNFRSCIIYTAPGNVLPIMAGNRDAHSIPGTRQSLKPAWHQNIELSFCTSAKCTACIVTRSESSFV